MESRHRRAELQQITVCSAGITANAKEAARAFIRFISTPAAAPIFAAKGLRPSRLGRTYSENREALGM